MDRHPFFLSTPYMRILFLLFLVSYFVHLHAQFPTAKAPVAEKKEHWRTIHGDSVLDNYYWMYGYFGKGPDSAKVVNYLKEENAYLDTMMSGTKKFQALLVAEMKGRIKENDESLPIFKNGYYYYRRTDDGKQYYKYCAAKN
jgi:oligopeptidase B